MGFKSRLGKFFGKENRQEKKIIKGLNKEARKLNEQELLARIESADVRDYLAAISEMPAEKKSLQDYTEIIKETSPEKEPVPPQHSQKNDEPVL